MSDTHSTEEKSAVELEREKINVVGVTKNEDNSITEHKQEAKPDEPLVAEADEPVAEAETAEVEEQIEASEKTEEELEQEKLEAKSEREKQKFQKRIDKEVAKRKALESRIAELEARGLPEKPVDEEIEQLADRKAQEKLAQKEFEQACNRLADAAEKKDKEFNKKVTSLGQEVGPIPSHMIGILDDLDNGGDVLVHLVNNQDDAEELYSLSPARMAIRLAKIAQTLKDEENERKRKETKKVSKVPEPNKPLPASGKTANVLHDKMSDEEWITVRNKQLAEKRAKGIRVY